MSLKKTLADYPHLIAQLHPTKNRIIDPLQISCSSHKSLWWKCYDGKWPDGSFADDHEWESVVQKRTAGRGCPFCSRQKISVSNCLATVNPSLALQWHPTRNGNLTPYDVSPSGSKAVWWKCYSGKWPDGSPADDHEWLAKINNRKHTGCPCCTRIKVVPSNCLSTTHPGIANQWHPTLNGDKSPNDVAR